MYVTFPYRARLVGVPAAAWTWYTPTARLSSTARATSTVVVVAAAAVVGTALAALAAAADNAAAADDDNAEVFFKDDGELDADFAFELPDDNARPNTIQSKSVRWIIVITPQSCLSAYYYQGNNKLEFILL